ncbi:carbohydrate ABC transporter permease [Candidatus Caldatribacterium sp. SIUC1]|uniref:carbohydrate ABC transporter permease n=1 Tax=Candidatus Caldatribacterium sp. SIUC1 TaxID=3418365 RepID=UPI003F68D1E6
MTKKPLLVLLVLPFSLFLISHTVPFFYGLSLSFFSSTGHFVGLRNYLALFKDQAFWNALQFTLTYAGVVAVVMTILGLLLGIFINSLERGQNFVKSILLIPWAISLTAWGLLLQIALSQQFGVVNYFLLQAGIIRERLSWLGNPSLARVSVILARVYKDVWFSALLFLTARQNIPPELYEESTLSGAGPWQNFRYITVPLLRPAILYIGIILFIFALQDFDLIYALTGGGPGFATEVVSLNIYRHGVRYGNYEYGIATSVLWSLIILGFTGVVFSPLQRRVIE